MKNTLIALVLLVVPVLADQKIDRKALPPAVATTADRESQGATVKGYSKEIENGQTYYEVETVRNGKTRDILIDSGGKVSEIEDEVDIATLPDAVQKGLQSAAGAGKITKVEAVRKGATTTYEAAVRKGTKKSEITVDAAGKVIK
jgi:uncharacterized membrane protein YkoI